MRMTNKKLIEKITGYLLEKGMRPNLKGFRYLRRAIELTVKNDCNPMPMTKLLYPILAKEFGETNSKVERAIRHIIQSSKTIGQTNTEFICRASIDICMDKIEV